MDRMSPLDASFLHIEDANNHMHIGSVAVFEGPPPAFGDFADFIAGKLPLVPRYRQRVKRVPGDLGRPVWVDDPHFNLRYHLRHTALPRPGGEEELRNLVGRLMAQKLDRTRPLWEMWVVEGLHAGADEHEDVEPHWALVSKVHHCMVDGISGTDLLNVVLDTSPERSPAVPDTWRPASEASSLRLAADALVDYLVSPYEQVRAARSAIRRPRRLVFQALAAAKGAASMVGAVRAAPPSSLAGPIGPHRRYAWARTSLQDVKRIRQSLGGTVNDVVLTVVTRGFRALIAAHGEDPEHVRIRSLVPVSVRRAEERGTYNNRVSAMFAELPVHLDDAVERLGAIREQMSTLKGSGQAVAAETLTDLGGFTPPLLLALGVRTATRALRGTRQRSLNTVTTNVPGPQIPLYCLGRRMVEAFPYVPIAAPMRVGVAIFSYSGAITFGLTADYDAVPDLEVMASGIEAGVGELLKAAEAAG